MDCALTLTGDALPLTGVVRTFSPTARWAGRIYSAAEDLACREAWADPDGHAVTEYDVEDKIEDAMFALGCPAHVLPEDLERALFGRVRGLRFVWEGRP